MAHSIRIPEPMRDLSSSEWRRFLQEFQIYLVASQQEFASERVKIAMFLNFIGAEALKIYQVKLFSEFAQLSQVFDYYEDFCSDPTSELLERFCFYKLKQKPGQKFSEFLLRVKQRAEKCNFSEEENMIRDAIVYGLIDDELRKRLLNEQNLTLEKAEQECRKFETTSSRLKLMVNGVMGEEHCSRRNSEERDGSVSGANEYQSVSSDYQSEPAEYQRIPATEYQPLKEYHTAQQEYQSVPEYQTVQAEYQSVQPEYHPLPPQAPQAPRSPGYGSPTHRGVPLRRADSRTFIPAPPQQRAGSPLNFQPQNYPRPPPNNFRPNANQPLNHTQQYRPQLPQRREESQSPNQEYQRAFANQPEKKPLNFNQVPPQNSQSQPQSPQSPQPPPIPRQPSQVIVRRPNPWALLKQKLPADVRQQFVPIRRPQFDGRMQSPDQAAMQRPPGDGQSMNMGMGRGGSPNQGMPIPNQGMQSPPPNPMYNGRPTSGNPQPKMGMPMQRPVSQEGRDIPSPLPGQGMQRVMSGERRPPFEMQRTDSMRTMDPRGMTPPQQGLYSPSPPRPMGDRGRETPPGPPRTPKPPGDDDDDVVYSPGDPRMNLGRGQPPQMRPPSGPPGRPGPMPSDLNRDPNTPRPLSRTESRQSFDMRSPPGVDNRGDPKLIPRESPLSRPLSSDLAKTPFQFRPESQHTPPLTPKPDFQSPRPPTISPQESIERSRGPTPQNPSATPKPSPDLRPASRTDELKTDSGKLTPVNGSDSRNLSPQSASVISKPESKPSSPSMGTEKPPSVVSGSVSPFAKSNEPSRTATPSSVGATPNSQKSESLISKTPEASQNTTPTPTKANNDSGTGTPLPDKDSGVSDSNNREVTPDRSSTPDVGKKEVERPKSLKRSPSLKQDLANSPDNEDRRSPLARSASRASSGGQRNDMKSPLQRKPSGKRSKTPKTPDGDHDSGVDETTQRKDGPTTNGDLGSPSKSPSKIPAPKRLSMPSPTKSSSKPSPKTPEAPPTADKKKVPMNKIQVGAAPSPNLKVVKSKIGSLQNTTHKPGGGNIKIENRKLDWKAQPRIAAKNDTYQPGGGDKKIQQVKLQWNAKSKIGSLENATHKPGGGEKKIESVKLDFKDKAKSKVGSKDNMKHTPGGGNVKTPSQDGSQDGNPGDIEDQKLELKVQSKIGSLDNVKHRPGGGDKKIFDDKEYLRQMSGTTSKAGSEGIPSGTQGEDGWSSARTSRRASRDRKSSSDRRYRSESRLGRRTPEPTTREDHYSLLEKHGVQLDARTLTPEERDENDELETQQTLVSLASEQTNITRDSSEDKDLNSNQTNSISECSEGKLDGDATKNKANNVKSIPTPVAEVKETQSKTDDNQDVSTKNQTQLKDITVIEVPEVKIEAQEDISKNSKQRIADKKDDTLPNESEKPFTTTESTTIQPNESTNNLKQENQSTLKSESKEDKSKEIKEVDSKEILNKITTDERINQTKEIDLIPSSTQTSSDTANSETFLENAKKQQSTNGGQ